MNTLSGQEIVFVGKITASVTHELRNVFAAIKENAALMEDLQTLSKDAPVLPNVWIHQRVAKMKELVDRGVRLTAALNTFAHTADRSLSQVDVKDAVEQVVFLAHRLAAFKGVSLKVSPDAQSVYLTTNPLRIQMVLFDCVGMFTEIFAGGGTLHIGTWEEMDEEARIDFIFEDKEQHGEGENVVLTSSIQWPVLKENVKNLNGRIELKEPRTWFSLVLRRDLP